MPRCFRPLTFLIAVALAAGAGQAQTVPPVGTPSSFDVATWNVEWFGSTQGGPTNEALQQENVADVIRQSGIDVWALQEIASPTAFDALLGVLGDGWAGMRAPAGGDQRLAYVYDPDVVDVISIGEVSEGMNAFDFASRLPYQLHADVSPAGGPPFELYVLTVHMKAGDTSSDFARRVNASQQLKAYTDGLLADGAAVIVLGDLNDELIVSISGSPFSPYANFLADDEDYLFLTEPFDQPGEGDDENTYCGNSTTCATGSVIDHLIITRNLADGYVAGSVARYTALLDVFDAHGGEFVNTTSDHLPVYARFALTPVANEPGSSWTFSLGAPYPNPFTDTATLTYALGQAGPVRLELFDALGRRVAVIKDEARPAGEYRVRFNGSALTPGLYVVRLTAGDHVATRRLVRGN